MKKYYFITIRTSKKTTITKLAKASLSSVILLIMQTSL